MLGITPLPWLTDRLGISGVPARLAFRDTPGKMGVVTPGWMGWRGVLKLKCASSAAMLAAMLAGCAPDAFRCIALAMA
jgi:hypothetical protein